MLTIPAIAYTETIVEETATGWTVSGNEAPDNCRGIHLDETQTIIAPCEGFFVPRERSEELLINEGLLAGEEAANAELKEENRQLKDTVQKNKKKLMNRKLWKGLTIGMALQGLIIIAIVAL